MSESVRERILALCDNPTSMRCVVSDLSASFSEARLVHEMNALLLTKALVEFEWAGRKNIMKRRE
jgi:hypothetical protein